MSVECIILIHAAYLLLARYTTNGMVKIAHANLQTCLIIAFTLSKQMRPIVIFHDFYASFFNMHNIVNTINIFLLFFI